MIKKNILVNTSTGLRVLLLILLECMMVVPVVFSQSPVVDKMILDEYNQYRSQYFQEKLFVHTDKDTYLSGEICWFRIYYMDAYYHAPANLSKIAYVEILDRNNRPVLQEKISLLPGDANGSMIISVGIPTGTYKFRAYTNQMKNFGTEYFFEKTIRIINPQNLETDSAILKQHHYDIQFFPEGGSLVEQIESKLAFRVVDAYGRGQAFEGVLFNAKGDTLLRFRPLHMGLGHFIFTPEAGQIYRALIRFPQGEMIVKDLPPVSPGGYVMRILKDSAGRLTVGVKTSPEFSTQDIYLMIHGSHSVMPVKSAKLLNHKATFTIDSLGLEDGISQVTLFTQNGDPVCERLLFKYPKQQFRISGQTAPEYGRRKKIKLELSATDQEGKPVAGDLSMAVYRLDSLQSTDQTDIRYYLYLSSEIGPIESPSFYFQEDGSDRREDMDNLLLTHGWRRFNWNDITHQKRLYAAFAPEYVGHIIHGTIVNNKTGTVVPRTVAYLSVPSTRTEYRSNVSDVNGRVKFEVYGFYGSQELIVQTNPREDSTAHIEIDNPFFQKYSSFPMSDFLVPSKISPTLLDLSINEQVQRTYMGARLNQFTLQKVDSNPFYAVPDEKYLLDDYTRFQSMEEVLREYVHSVNVVRKKDQFQLFLLDNPNKKFFEDEPLILIDGVPYFYTNELFRQDPLKIRRIDLVNRQYSLGYQTYPGIISLTTYHGDLEGIEMDPHATVLDYPGIAEDRQFFSPQYETEKEVSSRMPDYRTLLYWAPEIKIGLQAKKQLGFYSSDLPGKYAVVIQGLTETGTPGSQLMYFDVKK